MSGNIASQDFRDGAATGAFVLARRAKRIASWGVPMNDEILAQLAKAIAYEMGGSVFDDEGDS